MVSFFQSPLDISYFIHIFIEHKKYIRMVAMFPAFFQMTPIWHPWIWLIYSFRCVISTSHKLSWNSRTYLNSFQNSPNISQMYWCTLEFDRVCSSNSRKLLHLLDFGRHKLPGKFKEINESVENEDPIYESMYGQYLYLDLILDLYHLLWT